MTRRFDDRFDAAVYADDPPVHLWGIEVYDADGDLWIPERVWTRLCLLAAAYQLHLLPLFSGRTSDDDSDGRFTLNGTQCRHLQDEIAFVGSVVDDPLLRTYLATLSQLVIRSSSGTGLGIEHS